MKPTNRYRVSIMATISPTDELQGYNMLTFSRQFELEGVSFADVASKVDFIYDTVERASK